MVHNDDETFGFSKIAENRLGETEKNYFQHLDLIVISFSTKCKKCYCCIFTKHRLSQKLKKNC